MYLVLAYVAFVLAVLLAMVFSRQKKTPRRGLFVLRVLVLIGVLNLVHEFELQLATSLTVEAANPPAMVTCAEGVRDCTLTMVIPVRGSGTMQTCPEGNYDTMLSGVREEHSIKVFFSCDPNLVHLVHQAWEYGENDLVLPDGQPVELAEVKHVEAVSPGFIGDNIRIGPFDVFDGTKRR